MQEITPTRTLSSHCLLEQKAVEIRQDVNPRSQCPQNQRARRSNGERQRPRLMIVRQIIPQHFVKVSLIENHNMVQTLTSNRANQPFGQCVLPRTPRRSDDVIDPQRLYPVPELVAIDSVTVADQVCFGVPFGEGFDHLLCGPFGTRVFRDPEMKHLPPLMLQHDKNEQNPQADSRHGEEVDSDDFPEVVLQESLPSLGRRSFDGPQNTRNSPF